MCKENQIIKANPAFFIGVLIVPCVLLRHNTRITGRGLRVYY